MNTEMTLFERIKKIAKAHGYTLLKLNEKAGLGTGSIYNWKIKKPTIDNLQKVADVLGVSTDYLLGKEDKKTADKKDLQEFLKDNMEHGMTYAEHELTDEEKERLKIAMTQIFWKYHDKY